MCFSFSQLSETMQENCKNNCSLSFVHILVFVTCIPSKCDIKWWNKHFEANFFPIFGVCVWMRCTKDKFCTVFYNVKHWDPLKHSSDSTLIATRVHLLAQDTHTLFECIYEEKTKVHWHDEMGTGVLKVHVVYRATLLKILKQNYENHRSSV
jgi:hypothetical protein